MYEIHPNFADQWVLFHTGDGGFDVVAWFHGREDAEFARDAFELRRRQPHIASAKALLTGSGECGIS